MCIVTNQYSMSDLNNIDFATDFYASSKYLIPDAIVLYNIYNKKELTISLPSCLLVFILQARLYR